MREQHQEAAGDRQILLEMQELIAVAQLGVKQDRGGDAEPGQQQRRDPRPIADENQQAAAQFDRDRERQQFAAARRTPSCTSGSPIGGELGVGLVQEDRRQQDAAGERRGRVQSCRPHRLS